MARLGQISTAFKILIQKPYGKRLSRSSENNITMDLKEIGSDRIHLAQDRV
jgi:hypothetical protein